MEKLADCTMAQLLSASPAGKVSDRWLSISVRVTNHGGESKVTIRGHTLNNVVWSGARIFRRGLREFDFESAGKTVGRVYRRGSADDAEG